MKYKDKKGKKNYPGHLKVIKGARPASRLKNYRNILMAVLRENMVDGKIVIDFDQIEILCYVYDLEGFTQPWLEKNLDTATGSQWKKVHNLFKTGYLEDYLNTTEYIANVKGYWFQKYVGGEENVNYHTYSITQKGMAVVERMEELFALGENYKIDKNIGNVRRGILDSLKAKDEVYINNRNQVGRQRRTNNLERRINALSDKPNEQRPEHVMKTNSPQSSGSKRKK